MDKRQEWRPVLINGSSTQYYVNENGDLREEFGKGDISDVPSFIIPGHGYKQYNLYLGDSKFMRSAHRLAAMAFIPNPYNKPQVNHIDGNKLNNHISNLEWVTASENVRHAIQTGLQTCLFKTGEENITAIYTEEQIRKACELLSLHGYPPRLITNVTGVDRASLFRIKIGANWNHIAKDYEMADVDYTHSTNNVNNKFTEDQIHHVCLLLEEPDKLTYNDMSIKTGVSVDTIEKIAIKKVWLHISCMYVFPPRNKGVKYTVQQVHEVCSMLVDPYITAADVAKYTGVAHHTVYCIMEGRFWKEVSAEYNIPPRKNKKTERTMELYHSGLANGEILTTIMKEFNIPDAQRRNTQLQVYDVIKRNKEK